MAEQISLNKLWLFINYPCLTNTDTHESVEGLLSQVRHSKLGIVRDDKTGARVKKGLFLIRLVLFMKY